MTYTFFLLDQVAEGVYGAIAKEGVGALGNAGFVDLGKETLVFDTFLTPKAGEELRQAAETLTGNKVRYVVNSHWHGDHVFGNQSFPHAVFISTAKTRELMVEKNTIDVEKTQAGLTSYLQGQTERLSKETDDSKKRSLQLDIQDKTAMLESLPTLKSILPSLTFTDRMQIVGSKRKVELITFGGGHTGSDAVMYLPEDNILFAADLVLVDNHLWMGAGQPEEWLTILEELSKLDFTIVIPGHGPVGRNGKAHLEPVRVYVEHVISTVETFLLEGKTAEDAMKLKDPDFCNGWNLAGFFAQNVAVLLNQAIAKKQPVS